MAENSTDEDTLEEWRRGLPDGTPDELIRRHCDRSSAILTPTFRKYLLGAEYEKPQTASTVRYRLWNRLRHALLDAELLSTATGTELLAKPLEKGDILDEERHSFSPSGDTILSAALSDLFAALFAALYTDDDNPSEAFSLYAELGAQKMLNSHFLREGEVPNARLDVHYNEWEGEDGSIETESVESVKERYGKKTLISERPLLALVQAGEIEPEDVERYKSALPEPVRKTMKDVDDNPFIPPLEHRRNVEPNTRTGAPEESPRPSDPKSDPEGQAVLTATVLKENDLGKDEFLEAFEEVWDEV